MYLRRLRIDNLKLLRDFEMSFVDERGEPRMWTVLLGENGLCKTTILQAIAMAASGPVRAKMLANVPSLPDRRRPQQPVQIEAEFGFSQRYHSLREYPRLEPKPNEPPTLYTTLLLQVGQTDFTGTAVYNLPFSTKEDERTIEEMLPGLKVPDDLKPHNWSDLIDLMRGNPLVEARSRQLPLWSVLGYGVDRRLPLPKDSRVPQDSTVDRLMSLFGNGPVIGTGFIDLFYPAARLGVLGNGDAKVHEEAAVLAQRALVIVSATLPIFVCRAVGKSLES